MRLGGTGALALGLMMAGAAAVAAQEAEDTLQEVLQEPPPETQAGAGPEAAAAGAPLWLVSCSNQMQPDRLICESSQSIVITDESGRSQRLATAAFVRAARGDETTAILTLPLEMDLTAAPVLSVDGSELGELAWQSCDVQGCYASGAAAGDWLAAMRAGEILVAHAAARGGQSFDFTFQLQDFTAAEAVLP